MNPYCSTGVARRAVQDCRDRDALSFAARGGGVLLDSLLRRESQGHHQQARRNLLFEGDCYP